MAVIGWIKDDFIRRVRNALLEIIRVGKMSEIYSLGEQTAEVNLYIIDPTLSTQT